jgi:hypothetical protein
MAPSRKYFRDQEKELMKRGFRSETEMLWLTGKINPKEVKDYREWVLASKKPAENELQLEIEPATPEVIDPPVDSHKDSLPSDYFEQYVKEPIDGVFESVAENETALIEFARTLKDLGMEDQPEIIQNAKNVIFGASIAAFRSLIVTLRFLAEVKLFLFEVSFNQKLQQEVAQQLKSVFGLIGNFCSDETARQDALLRLTQLKNEVARSVVTSFRSSWERAEFQGTRAELIGEWLFEGVLLIDAGATLAKGAVKGAATLAQTSEIAVQRTFRFAGEKGSQLSGELASLTRQINQYAERNFDRITKVIEESQLVRQAKAPKAPVATPLVVDGRASGKVVDSGAKIEGQKGLQEVLKGRNKAIRENSFDQYHLGVRMLSEKLRQSGMLRDDRMAVINSFVKGTIKARQAEKFEFALRYYDNIKAFEKGRYLFPTFPVTRELLALEYKWNKMLYFKQWKIKQGEIIFEGIAAAQGPGLPGGIKQLFLLDPKRSLIAP